MMDIKKITIVGANGTMGAAVAGIFASFGNADVYLICRTKEKCKKAIGMAIKSVRAGSIISNLHARTYEELEACVEKSDWVFESVAEDFELKKNIMLRISDSLRPGTIISTGTSGLSVNNISEVLNDEHKKAYLGTHFFNPPYSLPLCELILTKYTDLELANKVREYLEGVLHRKVIKVKDNAGFLANRIGFQFLNEVALFAEEFANQGGIDYLDSIFGGFSGRDMKPLATVDFVGLDIHKAIIKNLLRNTDDFANDSFIIPKYIERLVQSGRFGRKSEEGFYKTVMNESGEKKRYVYDINSQSYRPVKRYYFDFVKKMVELIKDGLYYEAFEILSKDNSLES
jgi:3-hydroxyacyl-CoA dehydrogenase